MIHAIVQEVLRDSVAAHKRRCAIAQGVREASEIPCDHAAWNFAKCWCDRCGATAEELHIQSTKP